MSSKVVSFFKESSRLKRLHIDGTVNVDMNIRDNHVHLLHWGKTPSYFCCRGPELPVRPPGRSCLNWDWKQFCHRNFQNQSKRQLSSWNRYFTKILNKCQKFKRLRIWESKTIYFVPRVQLISIKIEIERNFHHKILEYLSIILSILQCF